MQPLLKLTNLILLTYYLLFYKIYLEWLNYPINANAGADAPQEAIRLNINTTKTVFQLFNILIAV